MHNDLRFVFSLDLGEKKSVDGLFCSNAVHGLSKNMFRPMSKTLVLIIHAALV